VQRRHYHADVGLRTRKHREPRDDTHREQGATVQQFVGHDSYVSSCHTNYAGVTLSCSLDKTVRLWHRAQATELWHFEPRTVAATVQFLPEQQFHFLTAHEDHAALWDMRMLRCHQELLLHDPARDRAPGTVP
jgi:WD40 repeat protein